MVRRDRHGRGLQGPLVLGRSPRFFGHRGVFASIVTAEATDLGRRWADEWGELEIAVEDLPPLVAIDARGFVPLGDLIPAKAGRPQRIVLYRRPIEGRAVDDAELALVIRDVLVERIADLLGRSPEEIDPHYGT